MVVAAVAVAPAPGPEVYFPDWFCAGFPSLVTFLQVAKQLENPRGRVIYGTDNEEVEQTRASNRRRMVLEDRFRTGGAGASLPKGHRDSFCGIPFFVFAFRL